jgi:hypothetical protein
VAQFRLNWFLLAGAGRLDDGLDGLVISNFLARS